MTPKIFFATHGFLSFILEEHNFEFQTNVSLKMCFKQKSQTSFEIMPQKKREKVNFYKFGIGGGAFYVGMMSTECD